MLATLCRIASTPNFFNHNCIGVLKSHQMWAVISPSRRTASPPRKRVLHEDFFRQSQFLANPANFVFKKIPQWLD